MTSRLLVKIDYNTIYKWDCLNNVNNVVDSFITKSCTEQPFMIPIIYTQECLSHITKAEHAGVFSDTFTNIHNKNICILQSNDFNNLSFIFDKYNHTSYYSSIIQEPDRYFFIFLSHLFAFLLLIITIGFLTILFKKIFVQSILTPLNHTQRVNNIIIPGLLITNDNHTLLEEDLPQRNFISYVYNSVEEFDCSICIESIKKTDIVAKLECNHIFHKDCIQKWFLNSYRCPNCNGTPIT